MNYIDKRFRKFIDNIRNQDLKEVYSNIRKNFDKIDFNIKKSLEDYFSKFPYWGRLKTDDGDYQELYYRAKSLAEHIDDFAWLYDKLGDYRSKKILLAILSNWYQFDFDTLNSCSEKNYTHYFDLDLVKCDEKEVFVDLGAYTGDTVIDYINCYGTNNYNKIYCYEITEDSFNILKKQLVYFPNIKCIKKAVTDKIGKTYINKNSVDDSANMIGNEGEEAIETVTLDDDIKERITMIKMDIEGSEDLAIVGAQSHIINDHPKLLISVYHNHEDLWKIPRMIDDICKGYNFYLRYYGGNIFPTEVVLIAIYKNVED